MLLIKPKMVDFNVIIEKGEDGFYISEVVELSGCHSQAKTIDELMERTREAIELCLEEKQDINLETSFVGFQKINIPDKNVQITID